MDTQIPQKHIRHLKENKSRRYFQLIAALFSFVAVLFTVFIQFQQSKESEYRQIRAEQDLMRIRDREEKLLNSSIEVKHDTIPQVLNTDKTTKNDRISNRLNSLEEKINAVSESTIGLRQAINPRNPDEVLTIARLKDELNGISKDLTTFQTNISAQNKVFEESIIREIGSSDQSSNKINIAILVALIPLVINSLITGVKGIRGIKNNKQNDKDKKDSNGNQQT